MTRFVALALGLCTLVVSGAVAQPPRQPPPPTIDFTFREDAGRTVPATITSTDTSAAELIWPESAARGWDTALLRVQMQTPQIQPVPGAAATPLPTPYVEIVAGGASDRQYFRSGESGPRWLNLSHLRGTVAPGARVSLRTDGMRIAPGPSTLRLYDARPDLTKTVLVLAPHPDDAEIAAFALYATTKSTVVTVTSGNAGSPTYEAVFDDNQAAEQYHFKGRLRVIDSITVPWQGGVPPERAFNLGYFDARLAEMHGRPTTVVPEMYGPNTDIGAYRQYNVSTLLPHRSRQSTWRNLVDDIETLLKKVNPAIIVAPHPQLDSHRDHQFTTVALAEALARWRKNVTLLLYTNHADDNRYPYGPAGTLASLPPTTRPVDIDRVFSLPVSPELQRAKLFALESMHDLRYSPTRQYQLAVGEGRAPSPEKTGPDPDITYLRRGPRSNEIFFVYDQKTIKPMIDAFRSTISR